ncbi:MAG: SH3 domain-containing protein [Sulfuricella sp.]|nr:SH3 domain-containing protein [Sulfuricella sp.]
MKNFSMILLLAWSGATWAEPAYVMDSVNAKLRSGKGENYRTLRIIPSKTEVEIIEPDDEFAKVKTADGQIGWIKSSLLKSQPSETKEGIDSASQATPMPEMNKEPSAPVDSVAKVPNEASAAPRFQGTGDMSFSSILMIALVAFLAGVGVGVVALRTYYLKRLHGLRI